MDPELNKLYKKLRHERCPSNVRGKVMSTIADDFRRRRVHALTWVTAGFAAIITLSIFLTSSKEANDIYQEATLTESEAAEVQEQTMLAFAYFAQTLDRASSQSAATILEVSLPPLRQGLRTTERAISIPLKQ